MTRRIWRTWLKGLCLSLPAVSVYLSLTPTPAAAGGGEFAAGLLGGLAAGTVVGGALAQPRYYAPYYYAPAPVYVPPPRCWFEDRQVWDGYGYVIQPVRVCD